MWWNNFLSVLWCIQNWNSKLQLSSALLDRNQESYSHMNIIELATIIKQLTILSCFTKTKQSSHIYSASYFSRIFSCNLLVITGRWKINTFFLLFRIHLERWMQPKHPTIKSQVKTRIVANTCSQFCAMFKLTWRIEKALSATYFCWGVAPLCWSLSGCRHNRAFWYDFFTWEVLIIFAKGTGNQPLLGHKIWVAKRETILLSKICIIWTTLSKNEE